jgi:acyl transferase domain-containing protein/acyl carrier protein
MLDAFEAVAATIIYHAPTIKLVSSMTGQLASASELTSARYWREHIRQPVRFADAVKTLDAQGAQVYIEIGPRPTLIGLAQQALPDNQAVWLPSIRESKDDWEQILDGLGKAYMAGVNVDWAGFDKNYIRQKVAAPTYPFQRDRYWTEASAPLIKLGSSRYSNAGHPLLGTRLSLANASGLYVWENEITLQRLPYLDDHRVEGLAIVPATAYMEMGMAAAVETVGDLPLLITEMQNLKPLFIREDDAYIMQVTLEANTDQAWTFAVFSHPSSQTGAVTWTKHVEGKINRVAASTSTEVFDPQSLIKDFSAEVSGESFYEQLRAKGNQWGATFQGIERLWVGDREALSFVRVPQQLETDIRRYVLHPAVADACGHVLTASIPTERSGGFVGGGVDETRVYERLSGSGLWCYARLQPDDPNGDNNVLTGNVKVFDENGTLLSETLGVHLWHVDQRAATAVPQTIQDWFYAVDWQVQDAIPAPIEGGRWLIVGDTSGVGDALAQHIQSLGSQAVVVYAADQASLTDAFSAASDWKGVVHLHSLDAELAEELTAPALNDTITANAASILDTIRAIKDFRQMQPLRLWLVTRGAQSITGEAVAVTQSAVWGLGKTITLEHGELWGGMIDIDPNTSAQELWQAICATTKGDDQQAIRDGQRYAARLVRRDLTAENKSAFTCHSDATYLITGGFGGLGLTAARWLAERGARSLILMGRTTLPAREQWANLDPNSRTADQVNAIQALEAMGVSIHLAAVDVGDESQLRTYLESYSGSPIRGVIHAAGVMQNQAMLDQPLDEMKRIFQPKIDGGWLLHTLLKDAPLDFFVMYSSAATLLSSPLNSSYAAANAFLNGLAHYRHAMGQPALSINWGMWGEVGMAVDSGITNNGANALMNPMPVQGALAALEQALNLGEAQLAIMAVTPKSWERIYATLYKPPFLSQLMSVEQTAADASAQNGFNLQTLREADPDDRADLLESFLAQQVSHVLGFGNRALDTDESLFDLGIDSLMAVELKNRIEAHLSMAIPMMQLLQGPSVIDLTEIILDQLGPNLEVVAAASPVSDSYEEGML